MNEEYGYKVMMYLEMYYLSLSTCYISYDVDLNQLL